MAFVHLHVHSEYSLLDGVCRVKNLADAALARSMNAIAVTDHGNMCGAVEFYLSCMEKNVRPVIGCEIYVVPGSRFEKKSGYGSEPFHLVLLCENNEGYHNLCKIVSSAWVDGFYYRPRADFELLEKYSSGLIALSACSSGYVARAVESGDMEEAVRRAEKLGGIYGDGNFYLEVQASGTPEQALINRGLREVANRTGLPMAATCDAHYIDREDAILQDAVMCVQMGKRLDDRDRIRLEGEYYLKDEAQMRVSLPGFDDAIENTAVIASRCSVTFDFGKINLPHFQTPDGMSADRYFEKLCAEGFAERFPQPSAEHKARFKEEISVIEKMGFSSYFLIVRDFVDFAKRNGIPVGPGRGSGAGSICAYCLKITDVDPVRYGLYFERFLNPERVSMPDFDIDFCNERRGEVIDYVIRKYGHEHVCQIIAFGTLGAKNAVRDIGRVMGIAYSSVDAAAKLIPFRASIEDCLADKNSKLREMYESDPQMRELLSLAARAQGLIRNYTTHAAGVLITRGEASDSLPLLLSGDTVVTQYEKNNVESLGLLKFDFLGLRNLTVIDRAVKMIRKTVPDFDINAVPDGDIKTCEMLGSGFTSGVFQMESGGMRKLVMSFEPRGIVDLSAAVALYRPGPMEFIPKYVKARNDPSSVTYLHPLLEKSLKETFGCIVYQEQVMEIVRTVAGYSLGRADIVRRAMAKKKADIMEKERRAFIYGVEENGRTVVEGALKRGMDETTAGKLFDEIAKFSEYAFNKAHSVCYAVIAYQTAYLKMHYPCEYLSALMTSVMGDFSKTAEYTAEAARLKIKLLPPDINRSFSEFTPEGGNIRCALSAVKNVGISAIERIVADREKNGPFISFFDFCRRMSGQDTGKRLAEALIYCGALDGFGHTRRAMIQSVDRMIDAASSAERERLRGQIDLFSQGSRGSETSVVETQKVTDMEEFSQKDLLRLEKEATGLYLSGHPMSAFDEALLQAGAVPIGYIADFEETDAFDGESVLVGGVIAAKKIRSTKTGKQMAMITIEDKTAQLDVTVFPETYSACSGFLNADTPIAVAGRIQLRDEGAELTASAIEELAEGAPVKIRKDSGAGRQASRVGAYSAPRPPVSAHTEAAGHMRPADPNASEKKLYLRLSSRGCPEFERVLALLSIFPGKTRVVLYFSDTKKTVIAAGYPFAANETAMKLLRDILGEENVKPV